MRPLRRFPIDDVSQVGEARRAAQALATELGFDADASGRLALVVTELGTNLVRHVGPGRHAELLVGPDVARGPGAPAVQVLGMDQGDGMDLEALAAKPLDDRSTDPGGCARHEGGSVIGKGH